MHNVAVVGMLASMIGTLYAMMICSRVVAWGLVAVAACWMAAVS